MRININVRIDEQPDEGRRLWMITLGKDWDAVTVTPSIGDHSRGRNWPECSAHITITNGEVSP